MSQRITIEYDVSEFRGHVQAKASEFEGMSDAAIEREVQRLVDEDVAVNVSFHAQNVAKTVAAIKEALKIEAAEEAEENS
jgi:hypothetical protein